MDAVLPDMRGVTGMARMDAKALNAACAEGAVAAMQAATLATTLAALRAEMLGLRLVLPCHETMAEAETRHRAEEAALDEAFDNLPV